MKRTVGLWVLCLGAVLSGYSQVDTSFIYNTQTSYGTLDLRLAKSSTRYYYLQEGVTFSYRESAPGVKTNTYVRMTTWNTSPYGEGNLREINGSADNFVMNYRLLKPRNYDPNYSPGYPIILMIHGGGEAANCWIDERCLWASARWNPITNSPPAPKDEFHQLLNNDRNLLHGGAQHLSAVNLAGNRLPNDPALPARAFPGFVLFPQSLNGWGPSTTVEDAIRILRLLIKKYNIDENRIYVHGLSNGGGGVYQAIKRAPWLFAAALPMSAVNDGGIISQGMVNEVAKLPLWAFQGGQDINPTPGRTYNYIRNFRNAGATVRYSLYPNLGHGTWNTAYAEPDFFSWMLDKKKNNPHVYFGVPTICTTTQVGVKMGFSKGYFAYQWQRNGQTLADATEAEYTVNIPGTYRGRFSRKPNPGPNDWEPWSDPIVVSEMNPQKPGVATLGTAHLRGPGLPSTNENNSVKLRAVDEAELYVWFKDGSEVNFSGTDVDDTLRTATITHAFTGANGSYTLVTYNNNCPSPPSDPISLFFNNSSPQNISLTPEGFDLSGTITSSSIFLSWNDISSVETGYEIWRRREGTPYFQFVTKTSANSVSYHDNNLDPGTTYEYKLRAVNNSGRSNYVPSDDINVNYTFKTRGDFHFPGPPQNLVLVDNTLNAIMLSWQAAKDENNVKEYWVYFGNDSINTNSSSTTYTLSGLPQNSVFPITVKAVDFGNHFSQPSNQIIATTYLSGLIYKHSTGAWESLDDPSLVATWTTPEFTGTVNNFTLSPRTQDDYFNFQFTGYLDIQTEGTYYFNVSSDDGSRLFLDGNLIVDNDGLHGTRTVASQAIYLTAGPHAIEVQYFDDVGGHNLTVRYRGPGVGDGANFVPIPDSALRSGTYIPPAPPSPPTGVSASSAGMKRIDISWQYADNAGTDYEVYRATSSTGPFQIVSRPSGTSAVDTIGLTPGTTYYYKVKTVTDKGASAFSNIASASTSGDNVPPTVPQNLQLISKSVSSLVFSWDPSTDNAEVVGYEIFNANSLVGTSMVQAFTAEDLDPNTEYVFTVKAVDVAGNRSGASAPLVATTSVSALYYSLAQGNLNDLSTWKSNADGTGDSPQNFSDNGQYFVVSNRTSVSPGGPWDVGGEASRVVIPAGVTFTSDQAFTANVELHDDAVLRLNHANVPDLVKVSPQSTVEFNAPAVIPANTYGHVVLSGTVVKAFDTGTTTILGDLTVHGSLSLKGAPHNKSVIVLSGALALIGDRPATAADNTIDLRLNGSVPQTITTSSDVYLYQLMLGTNQVANVINPSAEKVTIHLGSLNGGGLLLSNGSTLNVNDHHIALNDAANVNPDEETGRIGVNGGDLSVISTSSRNLNLYFTADNNVVNRLVVDLQGDARAIIRSALRVADGIRIHNGRLASQGNITLLADAGKTASIYTIENGGQITGNVIVQQYLPADGDIFWYLSSPVSDVNVAGWQQSFPITGPFTGSSPGATASSLFRYRENGGGWQPYPPSGGSNTLPIDKAVGYAAKIGNTPLTISVDGNPYQGNVSFDLTAVGSGPQSNGWNLAGNPYASPIVWSNAEGAWTRSGVNEVIAVRRNTTIGGQVRSQVIYYDLQLGGGVIAQGEAFWVKTFAPSPSLSVHEKAKVNPDESAPESEVNYIVVRMTQGGMQDAAYIVFGAESTDGLDPELDGRKLSNQGMFNLSTITSDTISLAVNKVSSDFCSKTIALNLVDVSAGSYSLSFSNLQSLTDIGEIILTDHFSGTNFAVTGSDYVFTVTDDPASYGRSRFEITFNKDQLDLTTPQAVATDVCAPGPGFVMVAASQEGALYQVVNTSGEVISDLITGNGETIQIEIPATALSTGANAVLVTAGFLGCARKTLGQQLTLNYLSQLTVSTDGDVGVCEGFDVTLEASGAPPSGFYKWYDGSGTLIEGQTGSTMVVSEVMAESVYYVSTALQDGCESDLAEIHIYPDTLDMPVILVREDTLYTDVVGFYQWRKDGADIPGATLSYFVPVSDGKYSLVASNGGCIKESEPYQVGEPPVTGVDDVKNPEFELNVYPIPTSGHAISILLRSPKTEPVMVEIIDALGRRYYSRLIDVHTLMQGADLLPQSPLYDGIYFLRLKQGDIVARKKIVVKN